MELGITRENAATSGGSKWGWGSERQPGVNDNPAEFKGQDKHPGQVVKQRENRGALELLRPALLRNGAVLSK